MTIDRVRREHDSLYTREGSEVTSKYLREVESPVEVDKNTFDSTLTKLLKKHEFVLGSAGKVTERVYLTPMVEADTIENDEMYWNPIGSHWIWKD